ncbi:MAG TPA: 50S ribosomal protein L18 [Candidatus Babeliales bacterium]|nr:50S ribosomal protein L18 [Candidatus Babeliales bacterium]
MNRLELKNQNMQRRAYRVRSHTKGVAGRPRLSVHISNYHITAQVIDDEKGVTLAYASTVGKTPDGTKSQRAEFVGKEVAAKAKKAKVKQVIFDRGSRKYHGRIKALAEAARKEGLEF